VPREIVVLDELPRSSTGKIARRDLQALLGGQA
jgi:acyl-coenzyme A synthetase/AMP-(fatty) acid ligase